MSKRIERIREQFSHFVLEWFERGLEFGLALGTIVNGTLVFGRRSNGEPLAPFLSSAWNILAQSPRGWAIMLCALGVLYHVILIYSVFRRAYALRIAMSLILFSLYLIVGVAVLTGHEPPLASFRYFVSAALSFGVFSALCVNVKTKEVRD